LIHLFAIVTASSAMINNNVNSKVSNFKINNLFSIPLLDKIFIKIGSMCSEIQNFTEFLLTSNSTQYLFNYHFFFFYLVLYLVFNSIFL
jgi:hypothetical protein